MIGGPYFATDARRRAACCCPTLLSQYIASNLPELLLTPSGVLHPTWLTHESAQISSCHGPAGGAPAAGVGGWVSTERIPRDKPPNLARRGEIATKTQKQIQTSIFT